MRSSFHANYLKEYGKLSFFLHRVRRLGNKAH